MVRTQRRGNGDKTKQTCIHSFFGGGAARSEQTAPQLAAIDLTAAPTSDTGVVRASSSNAACQPLSTAASDRRIVLKLLVQSTGSYTRSSVPVISRPACVAPRSSVPFWRNSELSDRNGLRVNRESSTNGSTGCGSTQSGACSSATRASSSATRNQECLHQGLRQHSPRPPARASRSR